MCKHLLWFLLAVPLYAQSDRQAIEAFNARFDEDIRTMNSADLVLLYEDDAVSLLPDTMPIRGNKAVRKFFDDVTSSLVGYKITTQKNEFEELVISGDWAWEWGLETQAVQPPGDKPSSTIHGKMLLVLHRGKDGAWRIKVESWNPNSSKPDVVDTSQTAVPPSPPCREQALSLTIQKREFPVMLNRTRIDSQP